MNSSTHTKQMKVGQWNRLGLGIGGALIIWGAPGEIGARSGNSTCWADETSFMALQLRAIGGLKLGLGVAFLGIAGIGTGTGSLREDVDEQMTSFAQAQLERAANSKPKSPDNKTVVYPPSL